MSVATGLMSQGAASARPREPWTPVAVSVAALGAVASLLMILVGYVVASGTIRESRQLIGVDIGICALLLSGVTGIGWLTAGYRAVRIRQRSLVSRVPQARHRAALVVEETSDVASAPRLVVVPGGSFFHSSTCQLVRGKNVTGFADRSQIPAQREACGVCRP